MAVIPMLIINPANRKKLTKKPFLKKVAAHFFRKRTTPKHFPDLPFSVAFLHTINCFPV
jgi:hypothetical protein